MSTLEVLGALVLITILLGVAALVTAKKLGKANEEKKQLEAEAEGQERRRESRAKRAPDDELVTNFMSDKEGGS